MDDSATAMINLEEEAGDDKGEKAPPTTAETAETAETAAPAPADTAADVAAETADGTADGTAGSEAAATAPAAAGTASADGEGASSSQPPAPPPQEPAGNGAAASGGSMVEALHPTVPVALVESVNIDTVPAAVMQALHQMPVAVALVAGGSDAQGGQRGGVKADGQAARQSAGGEGGEKVDKRFGKRSSEARAAVSAGMRSKANLRREKEVRISLGDRLLVAQKLENKEITAKEAQELLGCCKSYISQMMKPANLTKLKRKIELGLDPKLTKAHLPKFPQMEEALNKWIEDVRRTNPGQTPPVSMTAMQEKAIELALALGVPDFKASNSWFSNFVKRYGLDRLGFQEDSLLPKVELTRGGICIIQRPLGFGTEAGQPEVAEGGAVAAQPVLGEPAAAAEIEGAAGAALR